MVTVQLGAKSNSSNSSTSDKQGGLLCWQRQAETNATGLASIRGQEGIELASNVAGSQCMAAPYIELRKNLRTRQAVARGREQL